MIKVVWGSNQSAPVVSEQLANEVQKLTQDDGYLYIGYPIVGTPRGPMKCDALLLSKTHGLIAFDLVEGKELDDFEGRQDEIATMLEVKLKPFPELKDRRNLKFAINTITFAPTAKLPQVSEDSVSRVANLESLLEEISVLSWQTKEDKTFEHLTAAIQSVTSLRAGSSKRQGVSPNSYGARLKKLEESIANLDQQQSEAVIESVEGVQRIRGLAGSGKTIVLALKASYLHAQNPDWNIAVTFNTRSLKDQFLRLINNFTIEQTGSEPDWDKLHIINAWGAPGRATNDGLYHKFCAQHNLTYYDYTSAKNNFGASSAFNEVCKIALSEFQKTDSQELYDSILVDEAQDFPASFLRVCYQFLKKPKRLVYAYDELQSLTGATMAPPEEIFGKNSDGAPLVTLESEGSTMGKRDIMLKKCYRNSRPLLTSAHALGFGIYRKSGLIQFFDQDELWTDVGYTVKSGSLSGNSNIVLTRTEETSPKFLEQHSSVDELIDIRVFDNQDEMDEALIESIRKDISEKELKPEDILVINPDPFTTKKNVGRIRADLMDYDINSELAGVSTSRDTFKVEGAVTFTGIFRAKGNEAGMVYVINAHDCNNSQIPSNLALGRNRLFTAITRSKSWVRVWGIGPKMEELKDEWQRLKSNNFELKFKYPTDQQKSQLKLINKDLSTSEKTKKMRYMRYLNELSEAITNGEIEPDEIPSTIREQLKALK
ncbi:helicase [Idiomarina aquatica]|uniref:DNA 3'-5' helicase II n=2 Tax=Idiomarina aquatica TaxID=1327752 RepID=A0AA94EEN6_9GAMM|nr:helicase [Idiomarina aquatica]